MSGTSVWKQWALHWSTQSAMCLHVVKRCDLFLVFPGVFFRNQCRSEEQSYCEFFKVDGWMMNQQTKWLDISYLSLSECENVTVPSSTSLCL